MPRPVDYGESIGGVENHSEEGWRKDSEGETRQRSLRLPLPESPPLRSLIKPRQWGLIPITSRYGPRFRSVGRGQRRREKGTSWRRGTGTRVFGAEVRGVESCWWKANPGGMSSGRYMGYSSSRSPSTAPQSPHISSMRAASAALAEQEKYGRHATLDLDDCILWKFRSVTASGCCVSYTFPSSGLVMFDFSLGVMGWGGGDGLFLNSSFSSSLLHD